MKRDMPEFAGGCIGPGCITLPEFTLSHHKCSRCVRVSMQVSYYVEIVKSCGGWEGMHTNCRQLVLVHCHANELLCVINDWHGLQQCRKTTACCCCWQLGSMLCNVQQRYYTHHGCSHLDTGAAKLIVAAIGDDNSFTVHLFSNLHMGLKPRQQAGCKVGQRSDACDYACLATSQLTCGGFPMTT